MTRSKPARGRPSLPEEARRSTRIGVHVTPAQRLSLRRVATDQRIAGGMSGIIREAVDVYVAEYGERRLFSRK